MQHPNRVEVETHALLSSPSALRADLGVIVVPLAFRPWSSHPILDIARISGSRPTADSPGRQAAPGGERGDGALVHIVAESGGSKVGSRPRSELF